MDPYILPLDGSYSLYLRLLAVLSNQRFGLHMDISLIFGGRRYKKVEKLKELAKERDITRIMATSGSKFSLFGHMIYERYLEGDEDLVEMDIRPKIIIPNTIGLEEYLKEWENRNAIYNIESSKFGIPGILYKAGREAYSRRKKLEKELVSVN
ncbi:hypothetical protein HYX17_05410 [Candidatus Woesearchaeota archaeon]|nr:hypothetical protein [Candidatus Woesearchaeota archaeon]